MQVSEAIEMEGLELHTRAWYFLDLQVRSSLHQPAYLPQLLMMSASLAYAALTILAPLTPLPCSILGRGYRSSARTR